MFNFRLNFNFFILTILATRINQQIIELDSLNYCINQTVSVSVINGSDFAKVYFGDSQLFNGNESSTQAYNQYIDINKTIEQFIILSSKEFDRDQGQLESLEISYNANSNSLAIWFVSFLECGYDDGKTPCKEYLKNNSNLTLNSSEIFKTIPLKLSSGYNYFNKSMIKMNSTIRKGHIPIITISSLINIPFKNVNETYPDYVGFRNISSSFNSIFDIKPAIYNDTKRIFTNINIWFNFSSTYYSTFNLTRKFDSLGQFNIYMYSIFGGNIISPYKSINIQCIDKYTKLDTRVNKFELQCYLNETNLTDAELICLISLNVSYYGQSFQLLTVNFDDTIFQSFEINPYIVPKISIPNNDLSGVVGASQHALLFNNYVKKDGFLKGFEFYLNTGGSTSLKFLTLDNCSDIDICLKYIQSRNGTNISYKFTDLSYYINNLKSGYNYKNMSLFPQDKLIKNMIPILTGWNTFIKLNIDTSDGTKYPDFSFNQRESRFNPINANQNWRYYVRLFYDYDEPDLNKIKVTTKVKIFDFKNYYNITTWLNLTNGTKNSVAVQLKSNLIQKPTNNPTNIISELETEQEKSYPTSNQILTTTNSATDPISESGTVVENFFSTSNQILTTTKSIITVTRSFDEIISNFFSDGIENISTNELISHLENKTFKMELTSKSSLPIDLLKSSHDIVNCISNCSNQGLCKLIGSKFECQCNSDFNGHKCENDLRPCSNNPCLNSIRCENIQNGTQLNKITQNLENMYQDFNCTCKHSYYGKRCEYRINLCLNEKCSGNGLCKEIDNGINQTIKCECFGVNEYEGKKCEIKTSKMKIRETGIRLSYLIAITILISLYLLVILSDFHNLITAKKGTSQMKKKKKTNFKWSITHKSN